MSKSLTIISYTLYALIVFTPLARGSVQGWSVAIIHLITLFALSIFLLDRCVRWDWKWVKTALNKPILALLILCLLSSAFSIHQRSSLWAMVLLINYLAVFYLVIFTINNRLRLKNLAYLIVSVGIFLSVFGMFKKFGYNPFPWWSYEDLRYGTDLLSATYGNHNHLAGYLEMAIPLALGLFLLDFRGAKLLLMIYLPFIMVTALILSLSRGGWISFLFGLFLFAHGLMKSHYFKKKKLLLSLSGVLLVLSVIVLASTPVVERVISMLEKEKDAGFYTRTVAWRGVLEMIADRPLLGTGPGTFSSAFTKYQPPGLLRHFSKAHNDYLHFTSEIGVLLIPIIIWMIIGFFREGFYKLRSPSRLIRGITLGAMSGVTAMLFHSIIDFNLHIPANALLFTVLAALVAAPLPGKEFAEASENKG
ncbi:MAG: O-antigen ligase family protein [Thermodesulfobacteriota bacterium]|nr:O-antigen ligase family protein [Thermodesulfobacteriota bacterium]